MATIAAMVATEAAAASATNSPVFAHMQLNLTYAELNRRSDHT